jgi:hypothetical protein
MIMYTTRCPGGTMEKTAYTKLALAERSSGDRSISFLSIQPS